MEAKKWRDRYYIATNEYRLVGNTPQIFVQTFGDGIPRYWEGWIDYRWWLRLKTNEGGENDDEKEAGDSFRLGW